MLTKREFVNMLAEGQNELKKYEIYNLVNFFLDGIEKACAEHDGVEFVNFGTFSVQEKGNRPGRNLNTNEQVWIPGYLAPVFKPGKEFRKRVRESKK